MLHCGRGLTLKVSTTILMDSLHSVVPRALAELFRQGPLSQGKLEVAWRVAVGDALARVTTVRLQPDGVVEVRTADQRWNKELKRSSTMILTRLIGLLGDGRVSRVLVR
jgi:predicted nucleic acid-binding Zn ribbon protein